MGVLDPKVKKVLVYAGVGVFVILAALLVLKGFSLPKQGETFTKPAISLLSTPTPTPTPLPLAPGKQVYAVTSDSKTPGPAISEASFDPLDVGQGGIMTVSVKAKDASSVTVAMIDDSGKTDHALAQSSGVWSGSWTTACTHDRIYGATIVAKNTKGELRKVELWFR